MSTEDTDLTYAMKAFEQASLALRDTAWIHAPESKLQQPDENTPAAPEQAKKTHVITDADVDNMLAQAIAAHAASGLTPADIANLRAQLATNIGTAKSNLADMKSQLATAIAALAADAADNLDNLSSTMASYNERAEAAYEHFKDKGYLTYEDEKKRRELITARDAFPEGSKEWNEKNKEVLNYDIEKFGEVEIQAKAKGDTETQRAAHDVKVAAHNVYDEYYSDKDSPLLESTPNMFSQKTVELKATQELTSGYVPSASSGMAGAVASLDATDLESLKQLTAMQEPEEDKKALNPESIPVAVAAMDTNALENLKKLAELQDGSEQSFVASLDGGVSTPVVPGRTNEGQSRA